MEIELAADQFDKLEEVWKFRYTNPKILKTNIMIPMSLHMGAEHIYLVRKDD